jgi:hypothetical protein
MGILDKIKDIETEIARTQRNKVRKQFVCSTVFVVLVDYVLLLFENAMLHLNRDWLSFLAYVATMPYYLCLTLG